MAAKSESYIRLLNRLYHDLEMELTEDDVRQMKQLLLRNQIKPRDAEMLRSATDVFYYLEDGGYIAEDDLELLKILFDTMGKVILKKRVIDCEDRWRERETKTGGAEAHSLSYGKGNNPSGSSAFSLAAVDENQDDVFDGITSPEKIALRSTRWAQQLHELSDLKVKDKYVKILISKSKKQYKVCKKPEYLVAKGQGGTKVYLGIDMDQQSEVAVKCINYDSESQNKEIENTMSDLRSIKSCRNIVQYHDVITEDEFLYIVMELCERTLDAHLKHHDTMLPTERKDIVLYMFYGLKCLHDANIVHRDLKPQNILIGCDGTVKLTDFGISRKLDTMTTQNTLQTLAAGTPCWLSTEAISSKQGFMACSLKGDIQVAGMLAYYILSKGHHPFGTYDSLEEVAKTQNRVTAGEYSLSDIDSVLAKHLISWMLQNERKKRPSIKEVLKHPYVWEHSECLKFLVKLATEVESETGNVQHFHGKESDKKWVDIAATGEFKSELPDGYTGSLTDFLKFAKNCNIRGLEDKAADYIMTKFPDVFMTIYETVKGRSRSISSHTAVV